MHKNFSIQYSIRYIGQSEATVVNYFTTNNVIEFSKQITSSVEYFTNLMRFDVTTLNVGMLVRCYKDHHTISIEKDDENVVRVTTNQ